MGCVELLCVCIERAPEEAEECTEKVDLRESAGKPQQRLTRETWLKTAMEMLAREGPQNLTTVRLVARLWVDRGSFHHHFESREIFVEALLEYWLDYLQDDCQHDRPLASGQSAPAGPHDADPKAKDRQV